MIEDAAGNPCSGHHLILAVFPNALKEKMNYIEDAISLLFLQEGN